MLKVLFRVKLPLHGFRKAAGTEIGGVWQFGLKGSSAASGSLVEKAGITAAAVNKAPGHLERLEVGRASWRVRAGSLRES